MAYGRRRRTWSDSHSIPEKVDLKYEQVGIAHTKLNDLQQQLNHLCSALRTTPDLKWISVRRTAFGLKRILYLRRSWLAYRFYFLQTADTVHNVLEQIGQWSGTMNAWATLCLSGNDPTIIHPGNYKALIFPPEVYHKALTCINRWNLLIKESAAAYKQTEEIVAKLPPYPELKQHLPKGGRRALSAILACNSGNHDNLKPNENFLFGYCFDRQGSYSTSACSITVSNWLGNLDLLIRDVYENVPEPSGKPPSLKDGRQMLNLSLDPEVVERTHAQRRVKIINPRLAYITEISLCGTVGNCTASMLYQARRVLDVKRCRIANRMARKIMAVPVDHDHSFNDVLTILTDTPQRASGSDYYAPCLFPDRPSRGFNQPYHMVRGYVLFRKDWPDCYHSLTLLPDDDGPHFAATVQQAQDQFIRATLDRTTRHYFQLKSGTGDTPLKKKYAALKDTTQQIDLILELLEQIPLHASRQDSYDVGNCKPGTEEFIQQLQLLADNPERMMVSGKELAVCWRRSKYNQLERFASVVLELASRWQKQQEELFQQRDLLRWDYESPAWIAEPELEDELQRELAELSTGN